MNGISDKPEHLAHAEQTIGRPAGKDALNEEFARIAKAFASPRRVELLELLAQGERSVETLAAEAGMSITSSSAHLQVLRRACLVGTRREGTRVFYRLAGDDVYRLLADVRSLAYERLAEVDRAARSYLGEPGSIELVSREALEERLAAKNVVLVDLRPSGEYAAGHIPGALSIPHRDLEARLSELPAGAEIVTYCGAHSACSPRRASRFCANEASMLADSRTGSQSGGSRADPSRLVAYRERLRELVRGIQRRRCPSSCASRLH